MNPCLLSMNKPRSYEDILRDEIEIQRRNVAADGIPPCYRIMDDVLLRCNIGHQLKHIYRYGEGRTCGALWEDFKFCLSLKRLPEKQAQDVWAQRRAEWWAHRRYELSSEDVWVARPASEL